MSYNSVLIVKLSEDQGAETKASDAVLGLSASFLYLGKENESNYVQLSWNFNTTVNLIDWIGMFETDQKNPLLYMDYKNYGVCGSKSGSVKWKINGSQIFTSQNQKNHHQLSYGIESFDQQDTNNNNTSLCFKYYDGLTGALRATSPPLLVYSDAQISITSIVCKQLATTKNLLYYAKISCSGTDNCSYCTSYSSTACWDNLNFLFPVDRSAELKFAIKERHWSGDCTIGLVNIPIIDLAEKNNQNLAFVLRPHFSSNNNNLKAILTSGSKPSNKVTLYNNIHCQIVVSCRFIPQHRQSYSNIARGNFIINNTLKNVTDSAAINSVIPSLKINNKNNFNSLTMTTTNLIKLKSKHDLDIDNNVKLSYNHLSINSAKALSNSSSTGSSITTNTKTSMCSTSPSCSNSYSQKSNLDDECDKKCAQKRLKKNTLLSNQSSFRSLCSISNLPHGWEVRVDRHGRFIYLDHVNKRTTWYPPAILENQIVQNNKKYICARRTIVNHNENDANNYNASTNKIMSQSTHVSSNRKDSPDNNLTVENTKAVKFLLRDDFLHLMQSNPEALNQYNESPYLKHIVHHIRREPSKFKLFDRNRELVEFLNSFADKTQPFPSGWQTARHCGSNKQRLFIDHKLKCITLIDPRLPVKPNVKIRAQSAPPTRKRSSRSNDWSENTLWNIVNRTDEIQALVQERLPELAPKVNRKLQLISKMGEVALLKFANDIDLITALSILDQTPEAPTNEFEEKLDYFFTSLQKGGYGQGPRKINLRLRRLHLMGDAFDKILAADSSHLKKSQMTVTFDEEDGLDYGGPSRELFFLLSRDLFNPYYGLFEYSANDTYTVQISPISKFVDNYLQWMELCGRVLGLSLIHRCMIDTFFTRAFYKFLLGIPYTINDLQLMDSQFYNSLFWIRKNKITADLDLTFSTTEEVGGEIIEKELLPEGKNILVTESNKEYYISLILKWRMERSVEQQGQALLRGLYSIIDRDYLRIFDSKQLELVMSGTIEIDIEDWRDNTEYKGGYYDGHIVIDWFWQTIYSFTNADRLKLLQFVTGTSSIPYEGFKALRGSNGPKKFTIEKWGNEHSLPRAHTCFNRLDLPLYATQKNLLSKLKIAIYESQCYAIE